MSCPHIKQTYHVFVLCKDVNMTANKTTVFSPDFPHMDIIDLPGLVPPGSKSAEHTRELAKRYLRSDVERSIFLVAEQANVTHNNWQALPLIREAHLEDRSIGVFTKVDKLDTIEELATLREHLKGSELQQHGIVATINKPKSLQNQDGRVVMDELHQMAAYEIRHFETLDMKDLLKNRSASSDVVLQKIQKLLCGCPNIIDAVALSHGAGTVAMNFGRICTVACVLVIRDTHYPGISP